MVGRGDQAGAVFMGGVARRWSAGLALAEGQVAAEYGESIFGEGVGDCDE